MTTALYLLAIVGLGALYLLLRLVAGAYLKFRGTRVIACPEAREFAGVDVDARHAAITVAIGQPTLRVRNCSRWPERQDCGQECLRQIEAAPADSLVRTVLTNWYGGKSCVFCGKALGKIDWLEHKPALMDSERRTFEWHEIRAERIPGVLATHLPVCWNCHIAETFRRRYPDLVVDRSWKRESAPRNN